MTILEGILYMMWRGFAIGVIISAPMGPVGILCVQRTLSKGRKTGLYTGIGAAISDLFYCLLTGFGLSFIEEFLEENQNMIQLVGSAVLIGFAAYLFFSNPSKSIRKPGENPGSPKLDILNGFLFTVSNPLIIFLIIGLFARFNFLLPDIQFGHYLIGFLFIIIGALCWWWVVTFFVDKVRAHFNLRSMWLINKITGSIIGLFGVVGIITSIIGLASGTATAAPRAPVYLNSARGFHGQTEGTPLVIDAKSPVTLPIANPDFSIDFRVRDIHSQPNTSYDRQRLPGWYMEFPGEKDTLRIKVRPIDDYMDTYGPRSLYVEISMNGETLAETGLRDHFDWNDGWNCWKLTHNGGNWTLQGGERDYNDVARWQTVAFNPTEMVIGANRGGLINADWISLKCADDRRSELSYLANPDVLDSYLLRSTNPIEGMWEMYDRTMEENMLRPGGDYQLAIVGDADGGYQILYQSGATKNKQQWERGAIKGKLTPTSTENLFDVEWRDADGKPLQTEIKAEFQSPDFLNFTLPYLSSSFRLHKIR